MSEIRKEEQKLVEQLGDFVKLFVHKGEDGDDPPEEWAWTIRGSFPTGVMLWIRSHTDALILAAYEACAKHIENYKFLCEENERAYASAKRIFSQAIRSLASEAAREELEQIKAAARLDGAKKIDALLVGFGLPAKLECAISECIAELTAAKEKP